MAEQGVTDTEPYGTSVSMCTHMKWYMVQTTVKTALLHSNNVRGHGMYVYDELVCDMNLAKLLNAENVRLVRCMKPALDDPRTPRLRYSAVSAIMKGEESTTHVLGMCMFMNYGGATDADDDNAVHEDEHGNVFGHRMTYGINVYDFVGGDERLNVEADLKVPTVVAHASFLTRGNGLLEDFKSVDGPSIWRMSSVDWK